MSENEKKMAKEYLLSTKDGSMLGPFVRVYGFKSKGLCAVEFPGDGKMCYIDINGNKMIPALFDEAYPFEDGLALVENNNKCYYVNLEGKTVLEPEFEDFGSFSEGLAWFRKDGKYGYMDKEGKIVIPPVHETMDSFRDGVAFSNPKLMKLIDKQGNPVEPSEHWLLSQAEDETITWLPFKQDELFGFRDENYNVVIAPQFEDADYVIDGISRVKKKGLYGYLKVPSGEWLKEPMFADGNRYVDEEGYIQVTMP